jgi:hypothetical protein
LVHSTVARAPPAITPTLVFCEGRSGFGSSQRPLWRRRATVSAALREPLPDSANAVDERAHRSSFDGYPSVIRRLVTSQDALRHRQPRPTRFARADPRRDVPCAGAGPHRRARYSCRLHRQPRELTRTPGLAASVARSFHEALAPAWGHGRRGYEMKPPTRADVGGEPTPRALPLPRDPGGIAAELSATRRRENGGAT